MGLNNIKSLLLQHLKKTSPATFDNEMIPYIKTGIEPLDLILGEKGIPIGRITQIIGRTGAGKSALCINIMANLLKRYPNMVALYFDAENSTDILRLKTLGVENPENIIVRDFTLEDFYENIISIVNFLKDQEKKLAKLKKEKKSSDNEQMIREIEEILNTPIYIVLDSMSATPVKKIVDTSDPAQLTGLKARINEHFLSKIKDDLVKYNIILVIINQLRDNIQMGYIKTSGDMKALGTDKAIPGGKALKYYTFSMLYLIDRQSLKRNNFGFDGNKVEVASWKCKSFTPFLSVHMPFNFVSGYDNFYAKLMFLMDKNYIKSSGSVYKFKYYKDGQKGFYFKNAKKLYDTDDEFREAFDKIWDDAKKDFIYYYRDIFLSLDDDQKKLAESVIKEKQKKNEEISDNDVVISCESDVSGNDDVEVD